MFAAACFSFVFIARASDDPSDDDRARLLTEREQINKEEERLRAKLARLTLEAESLRTQLKEVRQKPQKDKRR